MIIVGLTGGIASGKTTITNYLKKKRIPTHESDAVVRNLYRNKSRKFLNHLKQIGLRKALKPNTIDKRIITNEILRKKNTLKKLEKFIHEKVKTARNRFIKKNKTKKKKLIILDIPLLFENKLERICDYTILAHCHMDVRVRRALKRKNIDLKTLKNIIKLQMSESTKLKKSDFIINTTKEKSYSYKQTMAVIKKIKKNHERNNT